MKVSTASAISSSVGCPLAIGSGIRRSPCNASSLQSPAFLSGSFHRVCRHINQRDLVVRVIVCGKAGKRQMTFHWFQLFFLRQLQAKIRKTHQPYALHNNHEVPGQDLYPPWPPLHVVRFYILCGKRILVKEMLLCPVVTGVFPIFFAFQFSGCDQFSQCALHRAYAE